MNASTSKWWPAASRVLAGALLAAGAAALSADSQPPGFVIVDDATVPWAPPTPLARTAFTLQYLPPGSQVMLAARPAEMLADEEGRLLVKALGPGVDAALAAVARACGCHPEEIETLHVGWQAGEPDGSVVGWAAGLVAGRSLPDDPAFRIREWGQAKSTAGETIHGGPDRGFWTPVAAAGRVLVAAPGPSLAAIIEAARDAGSPELALTPDLERLAAALDGGRHLAVLGSPHALGVCGRAMLAGRFEPLVAGIESLVGDSVPAAALSVHCGADFYVELDVVPSLDRPAVVVAKQVAERIADWPAAVQAYCAARDLDPYGRAVVTRLPAMIRTLAAHVRAGAERRIAVVNAYLPRHAGHNIVLATELALAEAPATATAAGGTPPAEDALGRLGRPMTIVFAKDTLERAIQLISDEIGVPMEIIGSDLQVEGVTKNQSFALDERDKPAGEILRVILAKADPRGTLVFVVRTQGGSESLAITTRAAAARRHEVLPDRFQDVDTRNEGPK